MLKFTKTKIKDVYIIEPQIFGDNRGYFMETYSKQDFLKEGLDYNFVQDNQSKSTKGVLRGLHFQIKNQQAKLVRVISGAVFDVAVDLRKGSETYGEYVGVELTAENNKQLLVPRGFAHGFVVLTDEAEFVYKCDNFYTPGDEGGLMYNDKTININWPIENPILSEKDKVYKPLSETKVEL